MKTRDEHVSEAKLIISHSRSWLPTRGAAKYTIMLFFRCYVSSIKGRMTVWSGDLNFDTENKTDCENSWKRSELWQKIEKSHVFKNSIYFVSISCMCFIWIRLVMSYYLKWFFTSCHFAGIFFAAVKSNIDKTSFYNVRVWPHLDNKKKVIFWEFSTQILRFSVFFACHRDFYWITTIHILYRVVGICVSLEGQS